MAKLRKSKDEFLGMPYGTAANRLKKRILFSLVQKLNMDACYRCGKKIKDVSHLSIEHKEPWLNVSVDLYWDLNNIAFSHLACNVPHTYLGSPPRERRGKKFMCSRCKEWKGASDFNLETRARDKIRPSCKQCRKNRGWDRNKKRLGLIEG